MSQVATNPFARYAYSDVALVNNNTADDLWKEENQERFTFTGGDLTPFVGNKKIGNLESITWSISTEIVGNYVMGRRDAVAYNTGKRVIVGSMVLSQYDRHALLSQIFGYTPGLSTQYDVWSKMYGSAGDIATIHGIKYSDNNYNTTNLLAAQMVNSAAVVKAPDALSTTGGNIQGISTATLNRNLDDMVQKAADRKARQKISYSDQIPPFDLTLVGVNKAGAAARCAIQGMNISQETGGFSNNDLGNAVGFSFTALRIDHWRQVESGTSSTPWSISE